jgi:hypothetical protein
MTAFRTADLQAAPIFTFAFCALRFDLFLPLWQVRDGSAPSDAAKDGWFRWSGVTN